MSLHLIITNYEDDISLYSTLNISTIYKEGVTDRKCLVLSTTYAEEALHLPENSYSLEMISMFVKLLLLL